MEQDVSAIITHIINGQFDCLSMQNLDFVVNAVAVPIFRVPAVIAV